jgi:5-methylcytosine-specific restriction endonuclease McrA
MARKRSPNIDRRLQRDVRRRANHICEYCHLPAGVHPTPFEIEHIISRQHGGETVLGNLAFSCLRCNRKKGSNISGILKVGRRTRIVALFNPRRHKWERHFLWNGPYLLGTTFIGQVTVNVLGINDPLRVAVRQALMEDGLFDR